MNSIESQCQPEWLPKSLTDELTESQEELLVAHLSACDACRKKLEQLAGAPSDWSVIPEALEQEQQRDTLHWSAISDTGRPVPADFAVDFLQPSSDPDALGRLDDIEIHSVIGHGGNGVVLKGYQQELKRLVAVKVMAPSLATSAAARKRFGREAQATAAIVHPNVMPILTVHSDGQLPYLVMPFCDCESLQDRLDREGSLPVEDLLRISHQVAGGLAAAHAQGLVHRDVKPANILLERKINRVMLTDFGLARAADDASLTRTGLIAGTPAYMSPEQAQGNRVDARSDLFSLGSVMYAMATGRPPFRAETVFGILRRVTDESPRPACQINSDIPGWLSTLIARFQHTKLEERIATAEEAEVVLKDCLAHVQQPSANALPAMVRQLKRQGDRQRWMNSLPTWLSLPNVVISVLLLCVTALSWNQMQPNRESQDRDVASTDAVAPLSESPEEPQTASPTESPVFVQGDDTTSKSDTNAGSSTITADPMLDWTDDVTTDLQFLSFELQMLDESIGPE